MEFHHLGKHCAVPHCKQLDFLPFKCSGCSEIFCLDHRTYASHNCSKQNEHDRRAMVCPICNVPIVSLPHQDPNIVLDDHINQGCVVKASAGYKCNMQGCKKVDVVPIVCKLCRRHHCVRHRFESDHKCPRKPQRPAISQKQPNNNNNNNNSKNNILNNQQNNNNNNNNNNNFSNNTNVYPGTVTTTRNQNNNYPSNSNSYSPSYNTQNQNNNNNNYNNNNNRNVSNNRAPSVSNSYNPNYSESTIGVRLTNGEMLRQVFNSNTTLREVQSFIEQNRTDGSAPYVMRTTYPPRELSFTDLDKTLAQLILVPSGVIILQNYQIDGSQPPQSQPTVADPNANVGWWSTISSFVTSFIPQ